MTFLYQAHSGLRYLVLLAALGAVVSLAYALAMGRVDRSARVLPVAFTALLDLQVLLGIGLVIGGVFPDAAVGHLAMMVLALVAAHGSSASCSPSRSSSGASWHSAGACSARRR
jgi:heme A synthase